MLWLLSNETEQSPVLHDSETKQQKTCGSPDEESKAMFIVFLDIKGVITSVPEVKKKMMALLRQLTK